MIEISFKYSLFTHSWKTCYLKLNYLTPNDPYRGRTAPLTSKPCILYIYLTNIGTERFKHYIYSMFLSLQNAVCFIVLTSLVPALFTFYIQSLLKLKKNNSGAKRLISGLFRLKKRSTQILGHNKSHQCLLNIILYCI